MAEAEKPLENDATDNGTFVVRSGNRLEGEVAISGAKNSVLKNHGGHRAG